MTLRRSRDRRKKNTAYGPTMRQKNCLRFNQVHYFRLKASYLQLLNDTACEMPCRSQRQRSVWPLNVCANFSNRFLRVFESSDCCLSNRILKALFSIYLKKKTQSIYLTIFNRNTLITWLNSCIIFTKACCEASHPIWRNFRYDFSVRQRARCNHQNSNIWLAGHRLPTHALVAQGWLLQSRCKLQLTIKLF